MKIFTFILALFFFQSIISQEITLRKGVVIDSLAVSDSISETFGIYLPTSYTPASATPILFIFDPQSRGSRVLQLFRQAAEEQGYILAASNNMKDDESLIYNTRIASRLVDRVLNFFPESGNRIYTAGLGDGARVATVLPVVYPSVSGVIAIGDIWINTDYIEKKNNFHFIGMAGYLGANYDLLYDTVNFLEKAGVKAEFYQYEGSNEWPNSNMISNVLGSITLNEMNRGLRPKNQALIESIYKSDQEIVQKLLQEMKYYKAYQHLEVIENKFSRFGKGPEIKQQLKELGRERLFRTQNRQYNDVSYIEAENRDKYIYFFTEDVRAANFENLGWWNQQIKDLKELQESLNPAETEMAFRLEEMLKNLAHRTFHDIREDNAAIDPLIFTAILQTIFDKENPVGYFNIISLSSQDGDYYTALLYLEDLLKTGYDEMESLYNIPGTLDLKLSPEYNELIKKYLGESKYYNN